jgi:hypothetical protein
MRKVQLCLSVSVSTVGIATIHTSRAVVASVPQVHCAHYTQLQSLHILLHYTAVKRGLNPLNTVAMRCVNE